MNKRYLFHRITWVRWCVYVFVFVNVFEFVLQRRTRKSYVRAGAEIDSCSEDRWSSRRMKKIEH